MRQLAGVALLLVASFAIALVSAGASRALAQKRVALVIGNSAYQNTPKLTNPKNDATDMAAALKALGYQVIDGFDLDKAGFDRKVRDFATALEDAAVGVFFYAGHGLQVAGQNYLVPVDAQLSTAVALDFEMMRVDVIHRAMERLTKTNVLFLDACRDNPLSRSLARSLGTRSTEIGKGLAPIEAGSGTLISFSTHPGAVASDGAGRNSPYAGALVKHLSTSNDDLNAILIAVRNDVMNATQETQVPWEHSALRGRFYFNPAIQAEPVKVAPARLSDAAEAWGATKEATSVAVLEAFITRYKETFYAALARARIEELKTQQATAANADLAKQADDRKHVEAEVARKKAEDDARAKAGAERQRLAMLQLDEERQRAEMTKSQAASEDFGIKRGGTLNFGVIAEPPNYDCHGSTTFALVHPVAPHYSLLVKVDGKDYPKVVPDLAESWSAAPDGMTYTFKIRSDVKFHDGSPLTSEDIKASYDRIINPPEGVISIRKAYYSDLTVEAPDPSTVVFKLKNQMAGVLEALASPFNCIYSAKKLKENPRYPETQVMGSGPFTFVEHVKGSSWEGKRSDGYFQPGKPYLDGFKIFFVKSGGVVPDILGGQFDSEFRGRNPSEKAQLLDKMKDNLTVHEGTWVNNLMLVFNTTRKPFDDIRVRQALSMAIDRWDGSDALSKISILKYVGGVMRPGYSMALPESELVKPPGFSKDIVKSREAAKKLLEQAGVKDLKFKLLNRNIVDPYWRGGDYVIDQWREIGVIVEHQRPETRQYQDSIVASNFDVALEFQADFMDDPTAQFSKFLTKKLSPSGYSGHTDTKIDDLYEKQRRSMNVAERTKIVNEMERYSLTQAYNVPLLWWQRIIVNNKRVKGWHMTPSNYIGQDLVEVWLDR